MAEILEPDAGSPLERVGKRLRLAREAAGLSRADIGHSTKIPERHLSAIEAGQFVAVRGRAYALGFARAYARVVGLDEAEIADEVRRGYDEAEGRDDRRTTASFDAGDPSRIPSRRTAWLAALLGLTIAAAAFYFWRTQFLPAVELPSLVAATPAPPAASPGLAAGASAIGQPVVFTATADGVWVKITDGTGRQLTQKELALGESYTLPSDSREPLLSTARAEALRVTVGGREVPLRTPAAKVKDLPVSAAALLAEPGRPAGTASSTETN